MAFTKVVGAGIHTLSNITSHNIHSSGIVTATALDISGNVSIGGTLTYEDVTSIDSVGLVTARGGVFIPDTKKLELGNVAGSADLELYHDGNVNRIDIDQQLIIRQSGVGPIARFHTDGATELLKGAHVTGILTATNGLDAIGIQSGGVNISTGIITAINFIGLGNTFAVNGTTVDVSISGNAGAGGTWSSYTAGIATTKSVGVNTNNLDDNDLVGVGNSFQGLYVSNGMIITDNKLNGNHYIGTAFNGLMAGPVTIEGTLTVDGNYVVV